MEAAHICHGVAAFIGDYVKSLGSDAFDPKRSVAETESGHSTFDLRGYGGKAKASIECAASNFTITNSYRDNTHFQLTVIAGIRSISTSARSDLAMLKNSQ